MSEPVALRYDFDGHGYLYMDAGSGSDWASRVKDCEFLYTHPLTNAEPIAWMHTNSKQIFKTEKPNEFDLPLFTPLYTHPMRELTDEEIEDVDATFEKEFSPHGYGMPWENFLILVKAILKKASEK